MARSQETFNKKEVRNKKEKKRKDKLARREARKENEKSGKLEDMIAYVDENGMITSTPPDPAKKTNIKAENIEIGIPKRDTEAFEPIRKGTVTFFNDSKGYGFIKDEQSQEELFFHHSSANFPIAQFDRVTFETEMGVKGMNAVRISKV